MNEEEDYKPEEIEVEGIINDPCYEEWEENEVLEKKSKKKRVVSKYKPSRRGKG